MMCTLGKEAENGMQTACDGMILQAQGSIYRFAENLVTDDPSDSQFHACFDKYPPARMAGSTGAKATDQNQNRCKRSGGSSPGKVPGPPAAAGAPSAAAKHSGRRLQASQQGGTAYQVVDIADIATGPLTARDPATGQTWNGWLETTLFMYLDPCDPEWLTESQVAGKVLVRPNDFNIQLYDGPAAA